MELKDQLTIFQPLLELRRAKVVESIHFGALAVCDASGNVLASCGNPDMVTYLRSSAKPIQILPLIESGAIERYDLTQRQIALMCASHSGTDEHLNEVIRIQERVGLSEENLLCGTHPPFDAATTRRLIRDGIAPTPNRHNCSGKHTGMLTLAKTLNLSLEDYIHPRHSIQEQILQTVAELCRIKPEEIGIGIDGCSAPVFALSLRAAATAFARFSDPDDLSESKAQACRTVFKAMTSHPEMVAGPGKFDSRLMKSMMGKVLSKTGAEGFQAISIAKNALGVGSPALGMAIKISDGDLAGRAIPIVTIAALKTMGLLSEEVALDLIKFGPRAVTNWRGTEVGEIKPVFNLDFNPELIYE
jgi:L-asparaginase II